MRAILLALALLSQVPAAPRPASPGQGRLAVAGTQSVPAYQLAKLTASNATAPLSWQVYTLTPVGSYSSGEDFVFTAPPGSYLVVLSAGNGSSTWQIQFTPAIPLPNPGPTNPTPPVIPTPPQPTPDPGGFIYPPDSTGFSAAVAQSIQQGPRYRPEEAAAMSSLYRLTANTIALDGIRKQPKHRTLTEAMALTKANEEQLVKDSKIRPIKVAFPEVARITAAELERQTQGAGDALTPQNRAAYVEFLNRLAFGFDLVRPQ